MKLPQSISSSVDSVAKAAIGKDWSLYATLIEHWEEIVGQNYAKNTQPHKILFSKNRNQAGGTLVIKLPKGLTMEFEFLINQIKERINSFFGYKAITKIIFDPYYTKEEEKECNIKEKQLSKSDISEVKNTIKDIENKELREALEVLGKSIILEDKF